MKTLSHFFWLVNALFAAYLGFTLVITKPMQAKDYQNIEQHISIVDSLLTTTKSIDKKLHRHIENTVEKEGNRSLDVAYLRKVAFTISKGDSTSKKLATFKQVNQSNVNEVNALMKRYEQFLVATDTAVAKSIKPAFSSASWYKTSPNPYLQKVEIANYQMIVKKLKNESVEILSKKVVDVSMNYPRIFTNAIPKNNIIEEGKLYESIMFLSVKPSNFLFIQNVKLNGKNLSDDEYYKGTLNISLPATADHFDENGECRKKWTAEITIANAFKDTTYFIEREYIIKRKK